MENSGAYLQGSTVVLAYRVSWNIATTIHSSSLDDILPMSDIQRWEDKVSYIVKLFLVKTFLGAKERSIFPTRRVLLCYVA